MAMKLTEQEKRERAETAMLTQAIQELRASTNLRFLLRQLFRTLGIEEDIPVEQTNFAMHQFGRQSAATDIKALIMSFDLPLYAELLLEDARYEQDYATTLALEEQRNEE